jgi:hypothetical protein
MRRYEMRSTMMTSNRPLEDWGKLLGDAPGASAILDRFTASNLQVRHSDPASRTSLVIRAFYKVSCNMQDSLLSQSAPTRRIQAPSQSFDDYVRPGDARGFNVRNKPERGQGNMIADQERRWSVAGSSH